jgi:hypothetical protein
MKFVSFRALALASLASLAMATSSSAVTILQYGQTNPADFKTATASGSTTTITTNTAAFPGAIPVTITNIGGVILPPALSIAAFERWTGVTSTGPATVSGSTILQPFTGTLSYTANPDGTGTNYLTAVFSGGILSGTSGGSSASLNATDPPSTNVVFSSTDARVNLALNALGSDRDDAFSISFSGITPGFGLSGSTIASFTGQNSGTFSSNPTNVIPEPSGLAMAGMAMLASLSCLGWRRRQSSRA